MYEFSQKFNLQKLNSFHPFLRFRLLFFYLVAASTFLVVSCFTEVKCPNDQCSAVENELEGYDSYYGHNRRLGCCKLTGLENYHIKTTYNDERFKRQGVLIIEKCKNGNILSDLISETQPTILRITESDLKTLQINDFTGGKYLTELNVTHNEIERLEPNIFIYAPNIEIIDLSNNRIAEVSEYSFDNIPKLRILILSNNLIKKFGFKSILSNLEVFMIGNNSLTDLNDNIVQMSFKLKEFCLNDNKLNISKLNVAGDLDVFDMSNNPTSIDLNPKNLKIKNSNVNHLTIHTNAVTIDASDNQIKSIVLDPQINNLIELNLSGNNLTEIQNLTFLTSIEKLDLSFNRIEDINLTSFYNMTRLKELNLENSGLNRIDFGLFSRQNHLNWLDISYNNLREFNFDMLTVSIQHLFIEGNSLTNIDLNDIHLTLPKLQVLGLSNNKFSCEKLIEIRKQLASSLIQMYVDEMLMVKFSRNINGIGCVNENSTTVTTEINSTKLLPIHTNTSEQNHFMDTIQLKIKEIEQNIHRHNESLTEKSINSKDDILSMKQELMNIRNDGDLKIIDAKADILMSVSRLFNVTTNGSDVSVDFKSTIEEVNKINLERYQSLSSQLKLVRDKLEDLAQSVTNIKDSEIYDEKNVLHLKQNNRITDDHNNSSIKGEDGGSVNLISLKIMMQFIIATIICLIVGFSLVLFYKRYYKQKRRYNSTNTVNTNVEQSFV